MTKDIESNHEIARMQMAMKKTSESDYLKQADNT